MRFTKSAILFVVVLSVALVGCPSKSKKRGPGASSFGSSGLAGGETGGSSLDQFQSGGSPTESGGPLGDVYFDYDSFSLSERTRQALTSAAEWLRANPEAKVEIEGHCDDRGTVEYNLALGARRAKATKDYLIALGIAGSRLSTISYGEELPVCRELTESCWSRNRRAHFVLLR